MGPAMLGFADYLRRRGRPRLSRRRGSCGRPSVNHPPSRCQPVGDSGLLAQQVEPQLPDLPVEVTGVGLAEVFGVLGEQADEEVDPAEVTVGQAGQPGPDFGLDFNLVQARHASDAISKAAPCSGAGGHVSSEDVVGMTVQVLPGPVIAQGYAVTLLCP